MKALLSIFALLLAFCASAQYPPPYVHNYWDTNFIANDGNGQLLFWGTHPTVANQVVIGHSADNVKDGGVAIGALANSSGTNNTAVGFNATAGSGNSASAFGANASAGFLNSTAIGQGATAAKANQVMLGTSSDETRVAGTLIADGVITGNGSGLTNLSVSGGGTGIATNGGSGSNNWLTNAFTKGITNIDRLTLQDINSMAVPAVTISNLAGRLYITSIDVAASGYFGDGTTLSGLPKFGTSNNWSGNNYFIAITNSGNIQSATFTGSGAGLTNLPAIAATNGIGTNTTFYGVGTTTSNNPAIKANGSILQPFQTLTIGAVTGNVGLTNVIVDFSAGNKFFLFLNTNAYFQQPTNITAGQDIIIDVRQDSTGGRTLNFATNYWHFPSASVLTTTTNGYAQSLISCLVGMGQTNVAVVQTLNLQ